jgi:hypothetical protein
MRRAGSANKVSQRKQMVLNNIYRQYGKKIYQSVLERKFFLN